MPEGERADAECMRERAADLVGRIGIVVAGNPDPLPPALQFRQCRAVVIHQARGAVAIMKAVAEGYDGARRIARDELRKIV